MNNSFWLSSGSGSLTSGDMSHDKSTRIDHKRCHHWFVGNSEQELFSNKRQAVEYETPSPACMSLAGSFMHRDASSWFGGQRGDDHHDPYGLKPVPSPIVSEKNTSFPVPAAAYMEKTVFEDQFKNDSLISLSMSQAAEDPQFQNTALRKVKVNEVTVPRNSSPELIGSSIFFHADRDNKVMGSNFPRSVNNYMRSALSSSKTNSNLMLKNHYCSGIENSMLSIGQAFDRGSCYNSLGHYGKENANFMPTRPFYTKDNFFTVDPLYGEKSASLGQDDDGDVIIPYSDIVENSDKGGQSKNICFSGFSDAEERNFMPSYDVLRFLPNHQSLGEKDGELQENGTVNLGTSSKGNGATKNKEAKPRKELSSNFPSNVKSLLSTGIFDGVPVKYVSWTREKNLRGVVKGTGYLCSCDECKFSKAVNAYEFECHAGGKTKHPNNHIYFENGKTVYAVVLELKATPHEMLFEKIQNVTGSGVNQKNFTTWRASYQAATRELQRIYGRDEAVVPPY